MTTVSLPTDPNGTTISADPDLPVITIVRDFAAPPDRVYRAWTDPELVVRWMGPERGRDDARPLGRDHRRELSLHDRSRTARRRPPSSGRSTRRGPSERLVQTFTWEGVPDGVSLETITFTDLGDGRTRVTSVSVVDSLEGRDAILASGMEVGVYEGYAKLDALLA